MTTIIGMIGIVILSIILLSLAIYCLDEPLVSLFILLCGVPLILTFLDGLIQQL